MTCDPHRVLTSPRVTIRQRIQTRLDTFKMLNGISCPPLPQVLNVTGTLRHPEASSRPRASLRSTLTTWTAPSWSSPPRCQRSWWSLTASIWSPTPCRRRAWSADTTGWRSGTASPQVRAAKSEISVWSGMGNYHLMLATKGNIDHRRWQWGLSLQGGTAQSSCRETGQKQFQIGTITSHNLVNFGRLEKSKCCFKSRIYIWQYSAMQWMDCLLFFLHCTH